MILVAFILFAALICAWLVSPGEVKAMPVLPVLQPIASAAD
jgi:hypothetical protein